MIVYTWGREGYRPEDLAAFAAKVSARRIVDVRLSPSTTRADVDWTPDKLAAQLPGLLYQWVPDLGTATLRRELAAGKTPQISNLDRGLRAIATWFWSESAVILLGDAEDPAHCSRGWLAASFAKEMSGIAVRHERRPIPQLQGALL